MDAIFNSALDRAIELDDKEILAYFDREVERNRRRREGAKLGGRPIKSGKLSTKPMDIKKKSNKRKYYINNIYFSLSRFTPSELKTTGNAIIQKLNNEYRDNCNTDVNWWKTQTNKFKEKLLYLLAAAGIPPAGVTMDFFSKCLDKWDYISKSQAPEKYIQTIFKEIKSRARHD
jgi:hypothetical protein